MSNSILRSSLLFVFAAGLAACGGGGDHKSVMQTPVQSAPEISGLAGQAMANQDALATVSFNIADADSTADRVTVTATSSDKTIVTDDNITVLGGSASRTLQIRPLEDAVGSTVITVRAVDPDGNATTRAVTLQVNAVTASFLATADAAFAAAENDDPQAVSGKTYTPDADGDPAAFDALLQ
jgi:hypothetical protein